MRSILLLLAGAAVLLSGCTHSLEITNLDDYYTTPPVALRKQQAVGITAGSTTDVPRGRYVSAIVDALQRSGNFERIIYPYSPEVHQDLVQGVLDINVQPAYAGSGSNFFINFPGFLIFAPAIWGYEYHADIATTVKLTHRMSGQTRDLSVPTKYTFRQAEIDRTWTELGWLEVGITPFIGGFFFMEYDPDVTSEFIVKVSPTYGAYVAGKIIPAIAELQVQAPPEPQQPRQPPAPAPAEPQQPSGSEEKKTI